MDSKKPMAALAGAFAGVAATRLLDLALIGGCLATAAGAVGFAGYMTMAGEHSPFINGMQYLAIFAQPSHPHRVGVDMNPVGAIPPETKFRVGGYQLVGAEARFAWLREGDRIFAVHPGDDVPRLGKIGSVEQRDGRWTLLDPKGTALLVSSLIDLPPSAGGRFDKRMIFGADQ
jgi:hypothetical protein